MLFDSIIESEGSTARTDALKVQVDRKLGTVGSNANRYHEIKYLDLVDAKDGNAWITSSAGTDIYWAYPNGTDENTEFTLLHFEGLHRDGTDSGFMIEDISKVEPEKIEIVAKRRKASNSYIGAGGFSPFALVGKTMKMIQTFPSTHQLIQTHQATRMARMISTPRSTIPTLLVMRMVM